jgi:short-subunit dehydrogenase
MIVLVGANSALAESLALNLVRCGETNFLLISRSRVKLDKLRDKLKILNSKAVVEYFISDFSCDEGIKSSLDWIGENSTSKSTIVICAGLMIEDKEINGGGDVLDSIYLNTILPLRFLEKKATNNLSGRIIIVSSIFSLFEKRGKILYSLSKRIFYKIYLKYNLSDSVLILMGPIYSPMYTGKKRFYVRSPSEISNSIVEIMYNKSNGVHVLPRFWKLFLPLLCIITWI